MNWLLKEEWSCSGPSKTHSIPFIVKVVHWLDRYPNVPINYVSHFGPHHWNVYAYIFPSHPRFKKFKGNHSYQDAAEELPFHGGPTFLEYHYNAANEVTSIQVGSDYAHAGDDFFNSCNSKESAWEVFQDAETLFNFLEKELHEAPTN